MSNVQKQEIRTCPFCGGEAKLIVTGAIDGYGEKKRDYWITCDNERCYVTPYLRIRPKTKEEAVILWNMRADDTYSDDGK